MILFIDNLKSEAYVPLIGSGEPYRESAEQALIQKDKGLVCAKTKKRPDQTTNAKRNPMSSLRNFAIQATATLTLAGVLVALLYTAADFATRGVVIA